VHDCFDELTRLGVPFLLPPTTTGSAQFATLRDTEGNLVQLIEMPD